jgi:hypothetical protein
MVQVSDDIVERLRNWDDGRVSTHYEGCWDSHPVCAILLAADAIEARDAEIERLRRWKAEATIVLNQWNEIAGDVNRLHAADYLGRSLPDIVATNLAAERAEVERLRAAGDALAVAYRKLGGLDVMFDAAIAGWEEARRDR